MQKATAATVEAAATRSQEFRQSLDQVRESMREQLRSVIGELRAQDAAEPKTAKKGKVLRLPDAGALSEVYATMVAAQALRAGMLPHEFQAKFPVRVLAGGEQRDPQLRQDEAQRAMDDAVAELRQTLVLGTDDELRELLAGVTSDREEAILKAILKRAGIDANVTNRFEGSVDLSLVGTAAGDAIGGHLKAYNAALEEASQILASLQATMADRIRHAEGFDPNDPNILRQLNASGQDGMDADGGGEDNAGDGRPRPTPEQLARAGGAEYDANTGVVSGVNRVDAGGIAAQIARVHRAGAAESSWAYARGAGRARQNDGVLAVWKAGSDLARIWGANGLPSPDFHELTPSQESAERFIEAINAGKVSQGATGAAVHVYGNAEYQGMRLFLAADGTAGVALKPDGDMVSVFSVKGTGAERRKTKRVFGKSCG